MIAAVRHWDEAVGAGLDRVFAPAANPWRHLGSLAFLAFVACAASGIYLYAVFDTSLAGAYDSGRALDAALAGTWVHLQRLSHVRAWPPAAVGVPLLASLVVLAWALPATSLGRADALAVPATLAIDWFFHFPHALARAWSLEGLWVVVAVGGAALAVLPFTGGRARKPAAVVDLANCNGCARCAADCPFGAVVMVPRSDARPHPRQASVIPDLCAACGICAGACPSSTPFRRRTALASGLDLPDRTVATLRAALDRALDAAPGAAVTFACTPAGPVPGAIEVECAAMVPPAFVQYALRRGAAGVVVAACREGDCEHRLGDRWARERIAGLRAPVLRASVPRERVRLVFCGSDPVAARRAAEELRRGRQ